MPLNANLFYSKLKRLKLYVSSHEDVSAELKEAYQKLLASFKATYTSEAFKEALQNNSPVDSNLEELLTSAEILMKRDQAQA